LEKVWSVLLGGSGGGGGERSFERIWREAGFQKDDPIADLKSSGILALKALVALGEEVPEKTRRMVDENRANVKTNYPLAVVAVNITLLLAELLHLRDKA
jgi:hypothetical protein